VRAEDSKCEQRILLVEDEPRMAHVIAKGLREQSYAIDLAHDGAAGLY
jgi:two-component system copper resistance phosphate regulon response regulator CusR